MEPQASPLTQNLPPTILIILPTLLFLLLLWWSTFHLRRSTTPPPPEPPGSWPILGHLLLLLKPRQPAHRTLADLADYHGPIFSLRLGVHRAVVVSDWQTAKHCLTTHDKAFSDRPKTAAFDILGYNRALLGFSPYGPYWREVRKIATVELLSGHRIQTLSHLRSSELRSFVKLLYDQSDGQAAVDMKKWFRDLNLSTMLRLVVGISLPEISDAAERDRYDRGIKDFSRWAGTFMISDALPWLGWLDLGGSCKIMRRVAKDVDLFHQRWLDDHRRRRADGEAKRDRVFVDVMLRILDHVDARLSGFDVDTIIKATSLSMILGGVDTISVTLTWTLSLLVNDPRVLKRAREELDSEVGKERNVNESDIERLVYLQAVLKEAMRLYPAAPLSVPRAAISDVTVNGYHVRAGTRLFVNLYKIHRDPTVWADALEFRPERFLVAHKDVDFRGHNSEYTPFGTGRRICPGITYAFQASMLTLATVLHGFELGSLDNQPIDMTEEPGLTCTNATPLELVVTPRLPRHLY